MAMLQGLNPPKKIQLMLEGNNEQMWTSFKEDFTFFMISAGFKTKSDEEKIALLINIGGEELKDIYKSLDLAADVTYKDLIKNLDSYFNVKGNQLSARKGFSMLTQKRTESVDQFITRVKSMAKDCDFADTEQETQMRDRIVFGCLDDNLRERFFKEKYEMLTFKRAVEICAIYQSAKRQIASCKETEETVHALRGGHPRGRGRSHVNHTRAQRTPGASGESSKEWKECDFCGKKHTWGKDKCPAYGKACKKCGKQNHFAVKCRATTSYSRGKANKQGSQRVNAVRETGKVNAVNEIEDEDTPEYVLAVNKEEKTKEKRIMAEMEIMKTGQVVKFQVDTGASVNAVPQKFIQNIPLTQCDVNLRAWNEASVHTLGKCRIDVRNAKTKKKYNVEFIVVKEDVQPIIGKRAGEQMQLVTVHYENIQVLDSDENIFSRYSDVFRSEVGKLPGTVHLTIDRTVNPVAVASCRVPVSLVEKVRNKLDDLVEQEIVQRVDEPTEWASRIVVAEKKNGDIRICIDPQALNLALKRELHPLPVIEDVLPKMSQAKVFSKFDLSSGYWQCVLDNESSVLTTFQTPFGRYRWNRLPFGLKVSSEIFQKRLLQALEGLDGVVCVADDVLIYGVGKTDQEASNDHRAKLEGFLERCRNRNIVLNREKTKIGVSGVAFLGHVIGKDGLRADPEKVKSILEIKPPTNVTEVQRLVGMVNYLAKFVDHLTDILEPIRRLTLKDVEWSWGDEQNKALVKLKEKLTTSPVLSFFDPAKQLVVQCDASQSGLGCVLMQDGRPISYASRAMTETEKRYAQIEKEMLAIVESMKKFHQYTYGRQVKVLSDHKPLQSIMKKPLCLAPKRLQCMMLKLQEYDIEIEYLRGQEMHIADFLSRSYLPSDEGGEEFEAVNHLDQVPIRPTRLERIRQESLKDVVLTAVSQVIVAGWPEQKQEVPVEVMPYFHYRDEMTVQDGIVFKGAQIVIPQSLRRETREALHLTHSGIEGTLRRARMCVFWPGMTQDIKQYIQTCEVCNTYQAKQQKESMIPHEVTDRPWEKIGVDLFDLRGKQYLITVDYYSNWFEVDRMDKTTSVVVIKKLKRHCVTFGIPNVIISDNGPQFTSEEFERFTREWDIEHRTSSPGHQQANGRAEAAVKVAKRIIKKAEDSHQDVYLALLEYRNVPSQDAGTSPAQRMLGRMTRSTVPVKPDLLKPQESAEVKRNRMLRDMRKKWYYDQHAKDLEVLEEGQVVRMRPLVQGSEKWRKGLVTRRLDERSYEVEHDGRLFRRNRQDLRLSEEPAENMAIQRQEQTQICETSNAESMPEHVPATETTSTKMSTHMQEAARKPELTPLVMSGATPNRKSGRMRRKPEYLKDYITKAD